MKQKQRQDYLENKETLNFLINITKLLQSSKAIIGRNDEIFVLDVSKVPKLLMNQNADFVDLFMKRKLILDHDGSWGSMNIVTGLFTSNNFLFCDIANSLTPSKNIDDELYPCHKEVRNWFLNIPQFSKIDKDKYEGIYQKNKTEMHELMQEYAEEIYKAIFTPSDDEDDDDQNGKNKLH